MKIFKNRKINSKKKTITILAVLFLLLAVLAFSSVNIANAQGLVSAIADTAIFATVGWISIIFKALLTFLIKLLASGIDSIIRMPITSSGVVQSSWDLVRNFTNMLFIIALIIMAFATIFNISGYDFRSLIARFLIAALLINFSLTIGGIIIDWTQSLSNVFLQAIGDFSQRIGQETNLANRFVDTSGAVGTQTLDLTLWQKVIAAFADVILLAIIFFSLAVLFALTLARIPILWGLLIVSPIAWITYILPSTKGVNRLWWRQFMGWNIFLPVYLFFIYFGVLFLNNRSTLVTGLNTIQPPFEDLFFYILIGIFLIGGAKVSMHFSMAAGAGAVAGAIWSRGRTAAWYAGRGIEQRAPGIKQVRPFFGAIGQRFAQIQRKATEAEEKRTDVWAKKFGVEGADARRFIKNVEEASKRMKDKKEYNNKETLLGYINKGSAEERVAAAKLLKEFHDVELNREQIEKVAKGYSDADLVAEESKFLAGVDYGRLSPQDLEGLKESEVFKTLPYRQQFLARITDAQIKKGRYGDTKNYMDLLKSGYGEKEDDVLDALRKTDKDFFDGLGKEEASILFNGFKDFNGKNMREAQRFIAERIMLKKGFFSEKQLEELMGPTEKGGIYESDLERSRALELAKETRLMSVLHIRRDYRDKEGRPALMLKNEDGSYKSYEQMAQEQVDRLGNEAILKQKTGEFLDEQGQWTEKGREFFEYLRATLERSPGRIRGMITSKDYTAEHQKMFGEMFDKIIEKTRLDREAKKTARQAGGKRGPATIQSELERAKQELDKLFEGPKTPPPLSQHLGSPATVMGGPSEPKVEPKKIPKEDVKNLTINEFLKRNPDIKRQIQESIPPVVIDEKGTWRLIKEGEMFEPGREFRVDLSSGKKYVKLTEAEIKKLQ